MILAPIFRKHREADAEQDATDDSRALVGYHPVFVFDESQTARRRYCSDWNRQRRSGFKSMLRITATDVAVDGAKLRLDGKLAGPWVCEILCGLPHKISVAFDVMWRQGCGASEEDAQHQLRCHIIPIRSSGTGKVRYGLIGKLSPMGFCPVCP